MRKIIFYFTILLGVSFTAKAQYLPSSTTKLTTPLTHDGNLRIGVTTSSADRTRNVINFGDGDYVKIGEWENDDWLSFKANRFVFNGTILAMPLNSNFLIGTTTNEGNRRLRLSHNGNNAYIDFMDNLFFRADKGWISPLVLYGNGTVGVGFTASVDAGRYMNMGYKLAVNGGILCEEVKVISDVPDADYVFEENYDLKSLQEVESFIKTNKHLPNIPSAEEFKTNGYKVGEMDEMLLRKVEELTLYMIELNKKIETLEKENKELKMK